MGERLGRLLPAAARSWSCRRRVLDKVEGRGVGGVSDRVVASGWWSSIAKNNSRGRVHGGWPGQKKRNKQELGTWRTP